MALSETFHVAMSLNYFCTIKHPKWYETHVSMEKRVKMPRKNVLVYLDFDSSKSEDDGTTTSSTHLDFSYEVHNTNAHDG